MTPARDAGAEVSASDEVTRLLALMLRHQLGDPTEAILELGRAGFSPKRIAELLGTTTNTANVTLQKAKARAKTQGLGRQRT